MRSAIGCDGLHIPTTFGDRLFVSFSAEQCIFCLECHLYCLLQVLCWLQFVSPFACHEWCRKVIKAARWYTHNVLNGQNVGDCLFVSFLAEQCIFCLECHLYCLYELQVLCWLQFVSPFACHEWCRKVIKAARWYTHNVLNGQNVGDCLFVSFLAEQCIFCLECHLYCLYELQVLCWLQFVSPFACHEWWRKVIKAARWCEHIVLNGQHGECTRYKLSQ